MRQVTISDGDVFSVVSHGNGTAYTVTHKENSKSVCFQGDDATQFRGEWEAYETADPDMRIDLIIGELTDGLFYE